MLRSISLLVRVLLLGPVLGQALSAQAEDMLTACLDEQDRSGYAYPDADGVWRGAVVDTVRELARRSGYRLALEPLPWARCLNRGKAAGTEAVDLAFYGSSSPQRELDYALLGPIHHIKGGVWFVSARSELPHEPASFAELGRYRLCGLSGFNYSWMKEVGLGRVDAGALSLRAVVVKLLRGRCDYLLGTDELRASAARHGIPADDMAALSFAPYPGGRVVAQYLFINKQQAHHQAVLESFSTALEELQRRGTVEQIYKTYGLTP